MRDLTNFNPRPEMEYDLWVRTMTWVVFYLVGYKLRLYESNVKYYVYI